MNFTRLQIKAILEIHAVYISSATIGRDAIKLFDVTPGRDLNEQQAFLIVVYYLIKHRKSDTLMSLYSHSENNWLCLSKKILE